MNSNQKTYEQKFLEWLREAKVMTGLKLQEAVHNQSGHCKAIFENKMIQHTKEVQTIEFSLTPQTIINEGFLNGDLEGKIKINGQGWYTGLIFNEPRTISVIMGHFRQLETQHLQAKEKVRDTYQKFWDTAFSKLNE